MQVPKRRSEQLRRRDTGPVRMTPEAMERMQRTIVRLKETLPGLAHDVATAKEHGDLSENAEYQHAKYVLRATHGRIAHLSSTLMRAEVIDRMPDPHGRIRIGATVVLEMGGAQHTYTILGAQEADPARGVISDVSPLGALLIGKRAGDTVTMPPDRGGRTVRIMEVR